MAEPIQAGKMAYIYKPYFLVESFMDHPFSLKWLYAA